MKKYGEFAEELLRIGLKLPGGDTIVGVRDVLRLAVNGVAAEGMAVMGTSNAEQDGEWAKAIQDKVASAAKSGFVFGKSSLKELEGVKTELVLLARRALELSTQDFCVYDGLRTVKEQERHVKNGTSKTMNSKHLKGLAVDLVPWIKGKPTWDWDAIYPIACAVDEAAREMGIEHKIRWGGAWDRTLADFHGDSAAYKRVVEEYGARQRALGKSKVFIDGPHFEWVD